MFGNGIECIVCKDKKGKTTGAEIFGVEKVEILPDTEIILCKKVIGEISEPMDLKNWGVWGERKNPNLTIQSVGKFIINAGSKFLIPEGSNASIIRMPLTEKGGEERERLIVKNYKYLFLSINGELMIPGLNQIDLPKGTEISLAGINMKIRKKTRVEIKKIIVEFPLSLKAILANLEGFLYEVPVLVF